MKADFIFFGGQSNMQGQTEEINKFSGGEKAYEYRLLTDSLIELKNPVGEDIGELLLASHLGNGSLVPYFVREYTKVTDKNVIAVHVAKGATKIDQWLKDSPNGQERYQKTIEKIRGALRKAESEKKYYVWLQGESDALENTTEEEYCKKLTKFKNDLKKDVGIDKFLIIKVGYFASIFGRKESDEVIMRAQDRVAREDEDFAILTDVTLRLSLDSEYINPDAVGHYNNRAMKIIGETAGNKAGKIRME